ncbi:hypothetical protein CSUI_003981, partial [Cystoisospora suis]
PPSRGSAGRGHSTLVIPSLFFLAFFSSPPPQHLLQLHPLVRRRRLGESLGDEALPRLLLLLLFFFFFFSPLIEVDM